MDSTSFSPTVSQLTKLGKQANSLSEKRMNGTLLLKDIQSELKENAQRVGLKYIGSGANRLVFTDENEQYVTKLGLSTRFRDGYVQNKVETQLSQAVQNTEYEDSFFQVVTNGSQYNWILMEKADAVYGDSQFNEKVARKQISNVFPSVSSNEDFLLMENIGYNKETQQYQLLDFGTNIPKQLISNLSIATSVIGSENIQ